MVMFVLFRIRGIITHHVIQYHFVLAEPISDRIKCLCLIINKKNRCAVLF